MCCISFELCVYFNNKHHNKISKVHSTLQLIHMQCPYVSCQKCSLKIEKGTKRNKVCVLKCHKMSTLNLTYTYKLMLL